MAKLQEHDVTGTNIGAINIPCCAETMKLGYKISVVDVVEYGTMWRT